MIAILLNSEFVIIQAQPSLLFRLNLRLFFAIDIDQKTKETINAWRQSAFSNAPWAESFRDVSKQNFHITLSFLGTIDEQQKQQMIRCADKLSAQSQRHVVRDKNLILSKIGLFRQPKVLYLGLAATPVWLETLATELKYQALAQNIYQEKRAYCPHLSICRKVKELPDIVIQPITVNCSTFSLYLSESTEHGVRYTPIQTWKL